MRKYASFVLLLGALILVGCNNKSSNVNDSLINESAEISQFVLDLDDQKKEKKSVEEYLVEAEVAKEKLRVLLEKKAEMEIEIPEDKAFIFLEFLVSTVVAQDTMEGINKQIEFLFEQIETALTEAEQAANSPSQAEKVQEKAEDITEEVEVVAEEIGSKEIIKTVKGKTTKWKERFKYFEERFLIRFKLSPESKEAFKARRTKHRENRVSVRSARINEREATKRQIKSGEIIK